MTEQRDKHHAAARAAARTSKGCAECHLSPFAERVVARIATALTTTEPNAEALLRAAVDILAEARPAIWVASLMTKDPSVIRVIGQVESNPVLNEYLDLRERQGLSASSPVSARVIESGEPLLIRSMPVREFIDDYIGEARVGELLSSRLPAELAVLVVPMRAGGGVVGTLGMYAADPSQEITEDELAWLQLVADQVAVAVEHARLAGDARYGHVRVAAVEELVQAVAAGPERSLVLNIVVERVLAAVGSDACDLLLVDESGTALRAIASRGFRSTPAADLRVGLDNGLLTQALNSRRVEHLPSAGILDHSPRRSLFTREGFVAYAAAPLIARGKLLGVLELLHRSDLKLDAGSSSFVGCAAGLAAVAVAMSALQGGEDAAVDRRTRESPLNLTATDQRVLELIAEGLSNSEIGLLIHLSPNTVKFHVRRLLDKAGAANRTDLTRRAIREGWV